jgi:hypothetical protein
MKPLGFAVSGVTPPPSSTPHPPPHFGARSPAAVSASSSISRDPKDINKSSREVYMTSYENDDQKTGSGESLTNTKHGYEELTLAVREELHINVLLCCLSDKELFYQLNGMRVYLTFVLGES